MITSKKITILRLADYVPDGHDLASWMSYLGSVKRLFICYDRDNPKDDTCMVAALDGKTVGMVRTDGKRFLWQLFDKKPQGFEAKVCKVFYEEGHSPYVKVQVVIDTDKVPKETPPEEWLRWHYSGLMLRHWGEGVASCSIIANLKDIVLSLEIPPFESLKPMIDNLQASLQVDMSDNATEDVDDLLFVLDGMGDEECDRISDAVERAYTYRRSKRAQEWFAQKYWPEFLDGDNSRALWDKFCKRFLQDRERCQEVMKEHLQRLDEELQHLPFDLFDYVDDVPTLRQLAFYKHIPWQQQLELMSALTLRHWLKEAVVDPRVVQVANINVFGKLEVSSKGDMNINKVIKNNGTIRQ